jgi:DNA end-binding protein Ku
VVDLMAALKKSLDKPGAKPAAKKTTATKKAPTKRAPAKKRA